MKLLIIEDEEKINHALRHGFEEAGFFVEQAFDGEKALKLVSYYEYDCIILDLMLPKTDGISVLKRMRDDKNFTPVIILTAKDEIDDKVKGLMGGADDYLAKPFSFKELLARVKALLRRTSSNQSLLKAGTLTVDQYKKVVTRCGKEIHISGKDFLLLEFLMRHKGAVVSEDSIIRYIWSFEDEISSNVVASHIKNLRFKIDKAYPEEKPVIHNIRGLGYRIDG